MALTYPYSLASFAARMNYTDLSLVLQRFDEMSGSGDGRQWAAQLATPLWRATGNLATVTAAEGKFINARALALDGPNRTFLFADPLYAGPASGRTTGLDNVSVSSIRADRGGVALSGLPADFVITVGDMFTVTYSSGRVYMGMFMESGTASASGQVSAREVRPYLPFGIGPGSAVEMVRPYFKAIIPSGGFTPYTFQPGDSGRGLAVGASITILQKP